MSKHNYSQYSNKKNNPTVNVDKPQLVPIDLTPEEFDVPDVKMEVEAVEPVETMPELVIETVDTVTWPKTVKGIVVDCAKLNVRAKATTNADVVCVLNVASEIEIDVAKSNADWFYVYTATGAEGYCMKKFVNASL